MGGYKKYSIEIKELEKIRRLNLWLLCEFEKSQK
jgi:hypothetical protein